MFIVYQFTNSTFTVKTDWENPCKPNADINRYLTFKLDFTNLIKPEALNFHTTFFSLALRGEQAL